MTKTRDGRSVKSLTQARPGCYLANAASLAGACAQVKPKQAGVAVFPAVDAQKMPSAPLAVFRIAAAGMLAPPIRPDAIEQIPGTLPFEPE